MPAVIYQALAEPVATTGESVTADRWHPRPPDAPKRRRVGPHPGSVFVAEPTDLATPFNQVIEARSDRLPRRITTTRVEQVCPVGNNPALRNFGLAWVQPPSEPVRKTPRARHGLSVVMPDDPLLRPFGMSWVTPPGEPIRKTPLARHGLFVTPASVDADIRDFAMSWQPQAPTAPPRGILWPLGSVAFAGNPGGYVEPEDVFLAHWWVQASEPVRKTRPRPPGQGGGLNPPETVGETVALDRWWVQASEPTRATPPAQHGFSTVSPPDALLRDFGVCWVTPPSEPVRKTPRAQHGAVVVRPADQLLRDFGVAWVQPPSEPARKTPAARHGICVVAIDDAGLRPFALAWQPQSPAAPPRSILWPLGSVAFAGDPDGYVEPAPVTTEWLVCPSPVRRLLPSLLRFAALVLPIIPPRGVGQVVTISARTTGALEITARSTATYTISGRTSDQDIEGQGE